MKRILSLILLTAIVLSFTACTSLGSLEGYKKHLNKGTSFIVPGTIDFWYKVSEENRSIEIKETDKITFLSYRSIQDVYGFLCYRYFSTSIKSSIPDWKEHVQSSFLPDGTKPMPLNFSIKCNSLPEYKTAVAKEQKKRDFLNKKKEILAKSQLKERKSICRTYGFKDNTDGMGSCLMKLESQAKAEIEDFYRRAKKRNLEEEKEKERKRKELSNNLIYLGGLILGGENSKGADSYSYAKTVRVGDLCPVLFTSKVKEEEFGLNKICYYE